MRSQVVIAVSVAMLAGMSLTGCGSSSKSTATGTNPSPYATGNYPGTLKIGNPYDIAGRTYYPAYQPDYVEEGIASWYGPGFHGRNTANGERFDQHALTAAHRTLPLPSLVRVTNLDNGKSAVLKVNDRGPFAKDRILDLSKASAEKLGVIAKGTAHVRVEYLAKESHEMIADLMQRNQLKADAATLTMLAMNDTGSAVTTDASLMNSFSTGRGVVSRAPLAPVVTQDLPSPPMGNSAVREEMRMARLERPAAPADAVPGYAEGGAYPTTMSGNGLNGVDVPPVGAIPTTMPPPPPQPMELQQLPQENAPATPSYDPIYTPAMPAPQARRVPSYEPEPVNGVVASAAVPSGIFIQAGSFSQAQNAQALSQRLASLGRTSVKLVDIGGQTWYRVRLGPMNDMASANSTLQNVQGMGLRDARVVKD